MKEKQPKNRLQATLDFLSSNRLAIYLIIAVSVASLVGVVVPQRYISITEDVYQQKFNFGILKIFSTIGVFEIFYTWWYRGLVGLLVVNLVLCSYKRFVRLLKLRRELKVADFERLKELSRATEKLNETADERALSNVFSAFGRLRKRKDKEGAFLFFEGGAFGRFGTYIIHLAVVLIILGGMLGNIFGIDGSINIPEGEESSKIWLTRGSADYELGFTIRCLDFSVDLYEGTQQPKDYKSHIQIIDDGKMVSEKMIEVNDPLAYGGFMIYQASYGLLGYRAKIKVEDALVNSSYELVAAIGDELEIADSGYKVTLTRYEQNYQNAGPALNLIVQNPDGSSESLWIFKESPDFDRMRKGRFVFMYAGEDEIYFTGLSVAKNPGLTLVWIGCAILFFGLVVSFLLPHRWAAVRVEKGKLVAAYSASKYRDAWQKRFEDALAVLKKGGGL